MKKYSWLNALENMSLVGLGAGSVASLLLNQVFYTTAPLSLLVVLGLANRRRYMQMSERRDATLAETDQYLALQVDRLHHQVSSMPTPETINRLNRTLLFKSQEISEKLHGELATLKQGLHQRLAGLEQQGLGMMRQEVRQVTERCNHLLERVNQLGSELEEVSTQMQSDNVQQTLEELKQDIVALQTNLDSFTYQTKPNLTVLQEHISRLDRQFNRLPPPVDLSSLKQEVAELIKIVADLVPRRDLSTLASEIRTLHDQQETLKQTIVSIETAALTFKRSFYDLPKAAEEMAGKEELSSMGSGLTPASVYPELQELVANYLGNLRTQLGSIQDFIIGLSQQQKQLRDQLNQLPQTLDVVALQRQLSELSQRLPVSEGAIESFKMRIQEILHQELHYINQQLQTAVTAPQSELIIDYPVQADTNDLTTAPTGSGSRAMLEQALKTTQNRLIVIWPWAEQCELDAALFCQFELFLNQGRQLEVGWCYLADRQPDRWLNKMQRSWITDLTNRNLLQETLHKLLQLKRNYPNQFQFKILGTNENFLVSDQMFAVVGIADTFTTKAPFPEIKLKLKTADPGIIQQLIQRFDNPALADDDQVSYWNRAVTRHDLGDKTGAIADYSHLLRLNPADFITYNYRGLSYYDLNEFTNAIADFTEAIRLAPQQPAAYCNRGFIYFEQGNYWEAICDYTEAIQVCPDYAIAYFYRGMTQQKLESYHDAIADYSEAIRLTPDAAAAYYYRGLTWQKLENVSEATADLELAAQFFWIRGSKSNAQKALKNIAKLRQERLHPVGLEVTSEVVY
jgi:tetratricopeptide (TPR) repeat protein